MLTQCLVIIVTWLGQILRTSVFLGTQIDMNLEIISTTTITNNFQLSEYDK